MPELPLQGGREPPPVRSGEVELPRVGVEAGGGGGGGIVGRDSVLVLADAVEQLLSLVLKRVGNSFNKSLSRLLLLFLTKTISSSTALS